MDPLEFETEVEGEVREEPVTDLPEYIKNNLDKANRIWTQFVNNLKFIKYEPRACIILCQVVIEYYVNKSLQLLNENEKDLRFDKKIELLKNSKIIGNGYAHDLLILYEIRNMYAHEIEILESRVKDKLNSIKFLPHITKQCKEKNVVDHYFQLFDIYRKGLQRGYLNLIIKEVEKQDSDYLNNFFKEV